MLLAVVVVAEAVSSFLHAVCEDGSLFYSDPSFAVLALPLFVASPHLASLSDYETFVLITL